MKEPKKEKKKREININFDGPNLDVNIHRDEEHLDIEVIKSNNSKGTIIRVLTNAVRTILSKGK